MEAISAGHEVTLEVAKLILQEGGNAFDAAIAAYVASWIAEPCMSSAGGGAFANVYTADHQAYLFDFFCQTPKQRLPKEQLEFIPIHVDFGEAQELYYGGAASMAVPGSIAGIYALHKQLGTIPMSQLLEPAIEYAKAGVPINNFQHYDLSLLHTVFDHQSRAKALFKPDGELINIGHNLQLPFLADFLDYLGHEGPNAFYEGEVAQKIVNHCKEKGGFLTRDDFRNYQNILRKPLSIPFRNYQILTNPLPSTGGTLIAVGLDFLQENTTIANGIDILSAFQKMDRFEKDPEKLGSYLQNRNRRGATSHFNILDRWGNAIALTMTLGEGSGHFVEGTDIHMNNMLGEESLVPQGWHKWKKDVRMSSMMSPSIAINETGLPELIIGSGGASRIPGAIMQLLVNCIDYDLPLEEAVKTPRMHFERKLDLEPGYPLDQTDIPENISFKYWEKQSMFFGGTHGIGIGKNKVEAFGDPRRDGVAWVK